MAAPRITWPDIGLAAVLTYVGMVGTGPAADSWGRPAPLLSYVLVAVACLSIVAWRWRPMWTFGLAGAATVAYLALGYAYGPIMFALVVAVYGLTSRLPVRTSVLSAAALLAATEAAVVAGAATGTRGWTELLSGAAWIVVPAAAGIAVKIRRQAAADVRDAQARRAVSEERLQLAQEMHDVVGHGLAVIAMQAGVALRVLDRDPAAARSSLEAIRDTSKDALDGLRAEVEALRNGLVDSGAPLRPYPGLADLPELAGRMRSSGLPVTVDGGAAAGGSGVPIGGGVPAEIDRAAYRIVQESLTNVLRHAGPEATATVHVGQGSGVLRVEVVDTGRGAPGPAEGHGITGMRERAEALGGTLEAGPRPSGGFAVRAELPVDGGASVDGSS
ncbi:MAG: sensor histidine kinase [bacterium]